MDFKIVLHILPGAYTLWAPSPVASSIYSYRREQSRSLLRYPISYIRTTCTGDRGCQKQLLMLKQQRNINKVKVAKELGINYPNKLSFEEIRLHIDALYCSRLSDNLMYCHPCIAQFCCCEKLLTGTTSWSYAGYILRSANPTYCTALSLVLWTDNITLDFRS